MKISQETQVRPSETYDATLDNTQAQTAPLTLQDDLNMIRTLLRKIIDNNGNWYDTPSTDLASISATPGIALTVNSFTPTLGQTVFTLSFVPAGEPIMFVNGIQYLNTVHFTVAGTTLTWIPLAGGFTMEPTDEVSVYYEA